MENNKQTYEIFLSYRREGGMKDAMLLLNSLERRGYSVFLDTNSLRENRFDEQLYQRIDECKDFILILPPNALDRCKEEKDWVRQEVEHAYSAGKNIVPIMLEGFEFPEKLPESIEFVRLLNGIRPSVDYYEAFIDKLTRFLKSEPVATPEPLQSSVPPKQSQSPGFLKYIVIGVLVVVVGAFGLSKTISGPDSKTDNPGENTTQAQPEPDEEIAVFRLGENGVLMSASAYINTSALAEDSIVNAQKAKVFNMPYAREQIVSIQFFDSVDNVPFDVKNDPDIKPNDVLAWVQDEGEGRYSLSIAADGGVTAPESCSQLFAGYTNLTKINFNDVFYMDHVQNLKGMFMFCTNLEKIEGIRFQTANIKDFSYMFYHCESLSNIPLQDFDTRKAETFGCMFEKCLKLADPDFSKFQTEQVTDFGWMFAYCTFERVDLTSFDTSNARTMKAMFACCTDLTEIVGLSGFDTSKVKDMSYMFYECKNLKTDGIENFNTDNVQEHTKFMSVDADFDWERMFDK